MKAECPVCGASIDLPEGTVVGELLECPECGTLENGDEADFQTDKDLSALLKWFNKVLELPLTVLMEYKEDGTISLEHGYPSE